MTPLEAAKFADLHDDVLREIADYLDLRRDDLSVRPPTHECPRAVLSRYHPPLCQTVTPPTHNQLRKSRRDLRAVCSRTLRAVAPDIAIKIETTEALMSWANTSETKAAVISTVELAVPWPEEDGESGRKSPGSEGDQDRISLSDFITGIFRCLETFSQVERLSITVLPFASKRHNGACASTRLALGRIQPNCPRLERLRVLEISSAEFECCAMCTESIINIFQEYIPQCDILKLGATPNLFRRSAFTSLINAKTLYVRTDRTNRGRHGLFDALKLSTISPNVRKLVLHSHQHFINLKCEAGSIIVDHVDQTWTFDRLISCLSMWSSVQELDIRLNIRVPDACETFRSYGYDLFLIEAHECNSKHIDQDPIDRAVKHYAASVMGLNTDFANHQAVWHNQLQVLYRLADALPNLRKVWFWAKLPRHWDAEQEKCRVRFPSCWEWNLLASFRIGWSIDRAEDGSKVYRRDTLVDGPDLYSGQQRFIRPQRYYGREW